MKKIFLFFALFLFTQIVSATEKLWIPDGTAQGSTVPALKSTPDAEGTAVWMAQPTPQSTQTPVVGSQLKDGHWVYPYPDNKTTESEGNYAFGVKDGVWKYYLPDGQECREMEFKNNVQTGNVVLWSPSGSQKYYTDLTDLVQAVVPTGFKVKTLLPYWVDLLGDGDHQLLTIARSDNSSMVLLLDENGHLLDSRVFDSLVDDFVFGEINKGGSVCFGYDSGCDGSLGVCQWEFDVWDGSKIKTVLQYQGWYGKTNSFTLPVFQEVGGKTGLVTDNGTFQWDESQGVFKKAP